MHIEAHMQPLYEFDFRYNSIGVRIVNIVMTAIRLPAAQANQETDWHWASVNFWFKYIWKSSRARMCVHTM